MTSQRCGVPTPAKGLLNKRVSDELPLLRPVMPELDSIRGLAILAVLFYHGWFWSYGVEKASGLTRVLLLATYPGWLGVELFFVLSGFLITGILLDSRTRPNYYHRFYVRRALRILPAYLAVLAFLYLFGTITFSFFLLSSLFLANVAPLFAVSIQYGPLWSLAVEEHYYLAWPAVVKHLSTRALAIGVGTFCVLSPVLRLAAFKCGWTEGLYTYSWFTWDGLAMGSLLAMLLRRPGISRRDIALSSAILAVVGASLLAGGIPFGILHRTNSLGACLQYTPWCLLFTSVLALAILVGASRYRRIVQTRLLRFFGNISFGLYLIHVAVFSLYDYLLAKYYPGFHAAETRLDRMFLRFIAASGISILVAALSRMYYEQPFLRMKDRWAPQSNHAK